MDNAAWVMHDEVGGDNVMARSDLGIGQLRPTHPPTHAINIIVISEREKVKAEANPLMV